MATIVVSNRDIAKKLVGISAGDEIQFKKGKYREPVVITGVAGTKDRPLTLGPSTGISSGDVMFKSGMSESAARAWANGVAHGRQSAGYYPTFGHLGDQAMLVLRNCQYVVLRGLDFEDCWPTAIYLDNCQHVMIHDVRFRRGTIAIGANGIDTHDIIVQHCYWQQDKSGSDMWNKIPWGRIHGASDNSKNPNVDIDKDYRHWDGDFFRAWNIHGNVIIRKNKIEDAFNGIHFFNSFDKLCPGIEADNLTFNGGRQSAANVLIEDNEFIRVRDNVFEPEEHAWNWVIRHNSIVDCYRPFSFEFERAGWFYIYGNTAAFVNKPSTQLSTDQEKLFEGELRSSVSLFKPKGKHVNEGPIHVMFNSWFFDTGKGVFPKFGLGKLVHANNAIEFEKPEKGYLFGKVGMKFETHSGDLRAELKSEEQRFSRRWKDYQISMNGDLANDIHFPDNYRSVGYDLGFDSVGEKPEFNDPKGGDFTPNSKAAVGTSIEMKVEFPDGRSETLRGGFNRGAVQAPGLYEKIATYFGFLPDDGWVPAMPEARPFPDPTC